MQRVFASRLSCHVMKVKKRLKRKAWAELLHRCAPGEAKALAQASAGPVEAPEPLAEWLRKRGGAHGV